MVVNTFDKDDQYFLDRYYFHLVKHIQFLPHVYYMYKVEYQIGTFIHIFVQVTPTLELDFMKSPADIPTD